MRIFIMILAVVVCFSFQGCSSCDGENAGVKLVNYGSGKADIQVKTSGGNTININNVLVETESETKYFAQGEIEFTINIQGENNPIVYNLSVSTCRDYTITINSDNTVKSAYTDRD